MTGFIKCDICGKFFSEDSNKKYDGLMAYYYDDIGKPKTLHDRSKYITDSNNNNADVSEMIDMCSDCFDKFVNWIRINKKEVGE